MQMALALVLLSRAMLTIVILGGSTAESAGP
jgi:hypothetical protein